MMTGLKMTECNGICLTAWDIGIEEYGDMIAYAHPDCPAHGNPLYEEDEWPPNELYFADRLTEDEPNDRDLFFS